MDCSNLFDECSHRDDLLTGGSANDDIFHSLHMSGSQDIGSSPATFSATDLELLDRPGTQNSLDRDLFLSILGTASSAVPTNFYEFPALAENSEKWAMPSDAHFAVWKPHGFPSPDPGSFLHQDASECCLERKHAEKTEIGEVKLVNCCHEKSGTKEDGRADFEALKMSSPSAEHRSSSVTTNSQDSRTLFDAPSERPEQRDSSDSGDAMDDEEGDKLKPQRKAHMSKNLASERRRRRKLNDKLYSLRAIVPKISKMDKASIVGDAISYVQDLQNQVETMQADILNIQSKKDATTDVGQLDCTNVGTVGKMFGKHKILELDVSQMEEQTYQLRIHCNKGPGVLVQLTRALEALDFNIVNANLTSVRDHLLNTIVVKMKNGEPLETEELRKKTLHLVEKFGLHL